MVISRPASLPNRPAGGRDGLPDQRGTRRGSSVIMKLDFLSTARTTDGDIHRDDAIALVDQILATAVQRRASDVHIEPTAQGVEVRLRIDGLLEMHDRFDKEVGRSLVARLMVMAHLL